MFEKWATIAAYSGVFRSQKPPMVLLSPGFPGKSIIDARRLRSGAVLCPRGSGDTTKIWPAKLSYQLFKVNHAKTVAFPNDSGLQCGYSFHAAGRAAKGRRACGVASVPHRRCSPRGHSPRARRWTMSRASWGSLFLRLPRRLASSPSAMTSTSNQRCHLSPPPASNGGIHDSAFLVSRWCQIVPGMMRGGNSRA